MKQFMKRLRLFFTPYLFKDLLTVIELHHDSLLGDVSDLRLNNRITAQEAVFLCKKINDANAVIKAIKP